MPKVYGDLTNIAGMPTDGKLLVSAPVWRPGGTALVTNIRMPYVIEDGHFATDSLLPGEVIFEFEGHGEGQSRRVQFPIVIPDEEDDKNFLDLISDSYEYPEPVVAAAQQAAREAREAAEDALAALEVFGSAEAVLAAEKRAEASASAASTSTSGASESSAVAKRQADLAGERQSAAEEASSAAVIAQGKAEQAATDAEGQLEAATEQANAAGEHAAYAEDRAAYSEQCANTSRSYNDTAWTARKNALTARDEAREAAEISEGHAKAAADARSDAQDAATNAASDVRDEVSALTVQVTTAAGNAKKSETNAKDSEDKARQYAESAGEAVATGVPDATDATKGKVRLAGDLGGTADAPTVPGLADKADTGHTHDMAEVDGLDALKSMVDKATYQATANTLVKRGTDGTSSFGVPTGANHAATKGYVDETVKAKTVTSEQVTDATSTTGRETAANKVVRTWTDGYIHVNGTPSADTHATPKSYVDSRIVVVASEDEVGTEDGVLYVVAEGA